MTFRYFVPKERACFKHYLFQAQMRAIAVGHMSGEDFRCAIRSSHETSCRSRAPLMIEAWCVKMSDGECGFRLENSDLPRRSAFSPCS
jgi:hypothetical protein